MAAADAVVDDVGGAADQTAARHGETLETPPRRTALAAPACAESPLPSVSVARFATRLLSVVAYALPSLQPHEPHFLPATAALELGLQKCPSGSFVYANRDLPDGTRAGWALQRHEATNLAALPASLLAEYCQHLFTVVSHRYIFH
jgi:hypothetical protein